MADSDAVRQQRRRRHKMGDHSMCGRNCRESGASLKIVAAAADPGEDLDPSAALRQLAAQLMAAYMADPGNAALAREARTTLLALAPARADGVDAEWDLFLSELSKPVSADDRLAGLGGDDDG